MDIMKFIKKHITLIVGIIVIVLIIVGALMLKNIFFPEENKAIYGNRLEGIEKVKITDKKKQEIEEALKEGTTSVKIRLAGRIINVQITVNKDTTVEQAQQLGTKALEKLSDEEKAYYDVQFLIANAEENEHFPIMGYKHHTKQAISWTKNR